LARDCRIKSSLVWDCRNRLQLVGDKYKLKIVWIPGHRGHWGNEEADRLAKAGASRNFAGPEPVLALSWVTVKSHLRQWAASAHWNYFSNLPALRQSKLFVNSLLGSRSETLLSLSRTDLRMLVGLMTGHCPLRKHLRVMGARNEGVECRWCNASEETPTHILCDCIALARKRHIYFGHGFPKPESFLELNPRTLISFIKECRVFDD